MKRFFLAAAALSTSALLWHLGTGLRPAPVLAILAPLPVLLLVPRVSAATAFVAGALSWLGVVAQLWPYFTATLEQPVSATVLLLGGTTVLFGGAVLLTRALLRRARPGFAVLALPAVWVSVEFLLAVAGPFGAWWSIAYSQAALLPLIQTASLTGVWGITFLMLLMPSAVAVLFAPELTRAQRLRPTAAAAAGVVVLLAFGCWRLAAPAEKGTVTVGLVAVAQPPEYVPVDSAAGRDMVTRVVHEIERLADRGADVVVLPEKSWRAEETTVALLAEPLTDVARRRGIHVVAGLILRTGAASYNAAIEFPSGVRYAKHFLIPGLEDEHVPGTQWRQVPGLPWALAICYDLDHPDLVRENQRQGARLLLVPALDFTDDYWLHSRMAVLRGVESGLGVARAPQLGELVASDSRGRVHAAARTGLDHTGTALARIPLTEDATAYARFGNWFGWVCVAAGAAVLVAAIRPRRTGPTRVARETGTRRETAVAVEHKPNNQRPL
ncbi:nitrilase-related carbon-nitrogen hydrolase [Nocardia brasiliensis]|uniref:nitrilase-related carbon-nitrogen hydrolase n=1 Tax=Nocardia brasiliensis TaxID=37326 RepID=UPI00142D3620|nr:nitrilase-related carbon-nitrogen hydrolase [Nocardia brasiliensis]